MMSQAQEAKFINGKGYYNNKLVSTTADSRHLIHQLMKGIWREDFVSPVEQELAVGKGFKVLDVGCGFGDWILQLSKDYPLANYVGLDLFPIFSKELSQKNMQFVQGDILKGLPFEDDTFDFVHMRLLLMLFTPVQLEEIVIKELLRVCKPGGWIEIADFDIDGKSMGPVYKRLLTFSIKYLETKGVNSLISEELPELIENTDQVEEVYTDEAYTPIGNWGGKTGKLAAEVFSSIINDISDLGISDEEKEIMTDQFVEEMSYYKTYIISQRFFCQKKVYTRYKQCDQNQHKCCAVTAPGYCEDHVFL